MKSAPAPRYLLTAAAIVVVLGLAPEADAQSMYKCRSADGRIEYRQTPCSPAARTDAVLSAPSGPTQEDQYAARERLARQQDYFRQKEAAAAAEALERERLALERRRIEQEEQAFAQSSEESKWLRGEETRHTGRGWERRSRLEWMEHDKAQAQAKAERAARRPMNCFINGKFATCN